MNFIIDVCKVALLILCIPVSFVIDMFWIPIQSIRNAWMNVEHYHSVFAWVLQSLLTIYRAP